MISTGAGDWLASTGELVKTEGGYLLSATKHFASGSPGGDLFVTSAPYQDPYDGWMVFHFPVSTKAEGVQILDNWRPMGMRGSGSNSVVMKNVFIPEDSIAARRPRGEYHAMWSVILPVALPLIMSVYCGIAKKAAEKARERCRQSHDPVTPYLLGEMENALTTAEVVVKDMISITDNFNFTADLATVNDIVKRKTIAASACKQTAMKAVEACGGPGYLRDFGIECLLRDVMASHFHPLQEKRQHLFTGYLAMDKEPPGQAFNG
ncbi:acyl-CoA dehydrogenase family protein [Photobacterium proteolyticum]|uniref:acyl-CoA dehydrogenase family protein n=1 Tax=Photobacterium proteolyticum TaxID=1903952 RepID=UPI001C37D789|nr:acyl-CoA dehydrogenase family protein [Photobacterium proteolyticum]